MLDELNAADDQTSGGFDALLAEFEDPNSGRDFEDFVAPYERCWRTC